ncbi:uncharacterized protein [Apostichopus japonicus]|uniref:uncharacterized protein isoform X2 n=1 Tax=Stichopus japonicus TaxID=307972 RepID=UPI003AB79220
MIVMLLVIYTVPLTKPMDMSYEGPFNAPIHLHSTLRSCLHMNLDYEEHFNAPTHLTYTLRPYLATIQTVRMFTTLVIHKMAFTPSYHLDGRVHHLLFTVKWIMAEDGRFFNVTVALPVFIKTGMRTKKDLVI